MSNECYATKLCVIVTYHYAGNYIANACCPFSQYLFHLKPHVQRLDNVHVLKIIFWGLNSARTALLN